MSDDIRKKNVIIDKESLSDEDALFYTLKHGHPPKYRLDKIPYIDENGTPRIKFILTNIPEGE